MPLRKLMFLAIFVASFSILVLVQNKTKKAALLEELSPANVELSCTPCGRR